MMNIVSKLTMPGKMKNEDYIWSNHNCAILFDGATSLLPSDFDAVDFINLFVSIFEKNILNHNLVCAINETIKQISGNADKLGSVEYYPSAAAVFVFENDDNVQILNIGDCTAVVNTDTKTVIRAKNSVIPLDERVIGRMHELHLSTKKNTCDILNEKEIKDMLLSNRKKINMPEGYSVLSFNTAPINEDDVITFRKDVISSIILYSDGFSLVEDKILNGEDDFEKLYHLLRKIENEDSKLNKYPRFKISDDASIIKITF